MSFSARKLALMGILAALAIALKLPILTIPNVEFFTFIVFASGYLLGMMAGAIVGIISMSIYTTVVTPYGLPPLPIAFAQVFSMAIIGLGGGLVSKSNAVAVAESPTSRPVRAVLILAVSGLVLTLIYDLFTNLASAYVIGQFVPVMIAAIPFAAIHILSNVLIFAVLTPLVLRMSTSLKGKV
jgi:energy-coupling factor transport system substrate-specific component